MRKSQASLEYAILIGVLVLALLGILYYIHQDFMTDISIKQAENVVATFANAADEVYALGPGSKNSILVTFPSNIESFSINNSLVQITIRLYGTSSQIYEVTKANMTGEIILGTSLTKKIIFEALDSGIVNITSSR